MLYDLGYSNFQSSTPVMLAIKKLGATLVDIRYSPREENTPWEGATLAEQLGSQYVHVKDLGNVNYRGSGIVIQDLEKGMKTVEKIMSSTPVILMCVCRDRPNCHRMVPIREFERMGVMCTHITKAVLEEILRGSLRPDSVRRPGAEP